MTPRSVRKLGKAPRNSASGRTAALKPRSEEHTSELQSRSDLECRLLLEKKKRTIVPEKRAGVEPLPHASVDGTVKFGLQAASTEQISGPRHAPRVSAAARHVNGAPARR